MNNKLLILALAASFGACVVAHDAEDNLPNAVQDFVASRREDLMACCNLHQLITTTTTKDAQKHMQHKLRETADAIDKLNEPTRAILKKSFDELQYVVQLENENAFEKSIKIDEGNPSGEDGFCGKLSLQEIMLLMKEKSRNMQTQLALASLKATEQK